MDLDGFSCAHHFIIFCIQYVLIMLMHLLAILLLDICKTVSFVCFPPILWSINLQLNSQAEPTKIGTCLQLWIVYHVFIVISYFFSWQKKCIQQSLYCLLSPGLVDQIIHSSENVDIDNLIKDLHPKVHSKMVDSLSIVLLVTTCKCSISR
jgi:hypothetical protein